MAVKFRVKVKSISTDGTNLFLEVEIFDGLHTLPPLRPSFPVETTAATIQSYLQTIADNRPSLPADIADLVNTEVVEA
jgi:hypothetical protein